MATSFIQPSFGAGELSPNLYARVDLAKYHIGAALLRNFFVDYRGGAATRAGTLFVGQSKQVPVSQSPEFPNCILIPFQFNITQTYVLEFGNLYIRFITDGAYIVDLQPIPSAITNANPGVVTSAAHGLSNGDWVEVEGIGGMTQLNGNTYIVAGVTTNTFTLTDLFGNAIDTTSYGVFTSGGTFSRLYTIASPYADTDLYLLKYTQSADTMTICHPSYPQYSLVRSGQTNWSITAINYAASQAAPVAVSAVPSITSPTPLATFSYVVTAVNAVTGEESIASNIVTCQSVDITQTAGSITITWNAAAGAASYNVYKAPIGYDTTVTPIGVLYGWIGQVVGLQLVDGNTTADETKTPPIHNDPFAPNQATAVTVTGGGSGYAAGTTATLANNSTAVLEVVVLGGIIEAIIVVDGGSATGTMSVVLANTGGGSGATFTVQKGPSTGTYPGCTAYFQQRQCFANSTNEPDTFWMSKPGQFKNFDQSIPVQATDAIIDSISAQQVNGIQQLIPMPGGLVVLTGLGAWQISNNGQAGVAVTPQQIQATPQAYNGCHQHLQAIPINYDILYVQAKGSIVRDLAYNFFVNIYTGTDLTVLSNHLFTGYQIQSWCYSEEPYKLVWAVRNDGALLSLTYLKEQDIYAWTHHDTFGLYQSITAVTEFSDNNNVGVDAVYAVVQRYINGQWVQYIERFDNRIWNMAEDVWAVDAGLQTTPIEPNATLTINSVDTTNMAAVFGTSVDVSAQVSVGQIMRINGGIGIVTARTSSTISVSFNPAAAFGNPPNLMMMTDNLPNTPPNAPPVFPGALAGDWTIWNQVTTVTGLGYLEGCYVSILADGSVMTPRQVMNGSITLDYPATLVTIGLGFQAQLKSLPIDTGNPTTQGKRKNIPAMTTRVTGTRGLKMGSTFATAVEFKERGNNIFAGQPIPLYTGDQRIIMDPNWQGQPNTPQLGQVCVQQDYPLPATVLSVIPELNIGDTGG